MTSDLAFVWDDAKAASNLAKHGVSFAYATRVLLDAARVDLDATRPGDGEVRSRAIGEIEGRCSLSSIRAATVRSGSSPPAAATPGKAKPMARFTLDPGNPPRHGAAEQARLARATDPALTAAAAADPDNLPLSAEELARLEAARLVRAVRAHTGLSQARFARAYHINVARLRDLEQGRTRPDSALLAYLAVIDREPAAVERALGRRDRSPAWAGGCSASSRTP